MKKIPNSLFEVRKAAGMTRVAFAAALGVAENYIYLVESGRKPFSPKLQMRVAEWKASLPKPEPLRASAPRRDSSDMARESVPAESACCFPSTCNLIERLDRMETQLQKLTHLLGATLAASSPSSGAKEKKAG